MAGPGDDVDGQSGFAPAMVLDQDCDLVGETAGLFIHPVTGKEVGQGCGASHLVDIRVVPREELATLIVEEHHWAVGGHKDVAGLVVEDPHLHVAGVDCVEDV